MSLAFSDYFAAQRIVFGAGELDRLGDLARDLGAKRVLLCTSGSYARNGVADRAARALGAWLAGRFEAVRPHVPEESVEHALDIARDAGVDAVVALGGGSALGTGKAVTARLCDAGGTAHRISLIAVPTTYAGSEMTPVYGVTSTGQKHTTSDARALARLVVYDPDLTLDLPADLTVGTGANALAHCVEGVYSLRRTPLATACALEGAARIAWSLPRLIEDGQDREARETMLAGAHLAGVTIAHAGMALHHAICHALGGAGVPHGVANAIMLPHVMRFNLPAASEEIAAIGRTLQGGASPTPNEAVDLVESLLHALPLPHRLRATGISESDIPAIAVHALESATARGNPQPATQAQVEEILRAAW